MQKKKASEKPLSFAAQAYQTIKDMIIRGQIEQGDVLSILYLADLLNIGRTPVTIACQRLECDGLVRIIPKQGVLINPMTVNDVRELYESRIAIEIFLADKAFEYFNKADIETLEASILRQHTLGEKEDAYGFMEEDTYFHRYIIGRYPNKTLMGMHHNLTDRIFLFGVRNSTNRTRLFQSIESHQRMVQALKEKDRNKFLAEIELNQMSGYIFNTGLYSK